MISSFSNQEVKEVLTGNSQARLRINQERELLISISREEAKKVLDIEILLRIIVEDANGGNDSTNLQLSHDAYIALHESLDSRGIRIDREEEARFVAIGQDLGRALRASRVNLDDLEVEPKLPHGLADFNARVAQLKAIGALLDRLGSKDKGLATRLATVFESLAQGLAHSYPERAAQIKRHLKLGIEGLSEMAAHTAEPGAPDLTPAEHKGWGH